jgi:hypothetical protein
MEAPLSYFKSLLCTSYQTCCRDPKLDVALVANTTCLIAHAGLTDVELALKDPSHSNFCAYSTGIPHDLLVSPPGAICLLLEAVTDGFTLDTCQSSFCPLGVDGHANFVSAILQLIRTYSIPLGAIFGSIVITPATWSHLDPF